MGIKNSVFGKTIDINVILKYNKCIKGGDSHGNHCTFTGAKSS